MMNDYLGHTALSTFTKLRQHVSLLSYGWIYLHIKKKTATKQKSNPTNPPFFTKKKQSKPGQN
jgi:hypothetical protein